MHCDYSNCPHTAHLVLPTRRPSHLIWLSHTLSYRLSYLFRFQVGAMSLHLPLICMGSANKRRHELGRSVSIPRVRYFRPHRQSRRPPERTEWCLIHGEEKEAGFVYRRKEGKRSEYYYYYFCFFLRCLAITDRLKAPLPHTPHTHAVVEAPDMISPRL